MEQPKVSVIIPALRGITDSCMDSLLAQSCREMEVLCLCAEVPESLTAAAAKDSRIRIVREDFPNTGAAANLGLELARGCYVLVLKGTETAARDLLERALNRAEETAADITVFCGYTVSRVGNEKKDDADGYDRRLTGRLTNFSLREQFPDRYFSVLKGSMPFRLLRADFVKRQALRFPELEECWEVPFCAGCDARADRVALLDRRMLTALPETAPADPRNVLTAFDKMADSLGTDQAALRLLVEFATAAFRRSCADFGSADARLLYTGLQSRFVSPLFTGLDKDSLTNRERCLFDTVAVTSYEEMLARISVPLVVSFTSFPKRIDYTVRVIDNVHRQTRKADKVLLYLAPEQFPQKEAQLPQALLDQVNQGLVEIRWVPDVRSHKKYHYVMRDFPDSLIVTLDDDLQYPDDMLENLLHCYLCHPDKVSAMRAHLTVLDTAAGLLLPYNRWVKEYRGATYIPSPQLFVTSGAGTLFPPRVLHPLALDLEKAWGLCPYADDVWLNLMTLLNGRCVVLAVDDFTMKNMPGSQEEALQSINVDQNQNDVQYDKIRCWLKEEFGRDVIWEALTAGDPAVRCRTVTDLSDQYLALDEARKQVQNKLHQTWADKVSREQDNAKLLKELHRLQQELAAERRSFRVLRKIRNLLRNIRSKGLTQTVKRILKK